MDLRPDAAWFPTMPFETMRRNVHAAKTGAYVATLADRSTRAELDAGYSSFPKRAQVRVHAESGLVGRPAFPAIDPDGHRPRPLDQQAVSDLAIVDDTDDLDDGERARLHEALRRSIAQAKAGNLVDADEVVARLLNRK